MSLSVWEAPPKKVGGTSVSAIHIQVHSEAGKPLRSVASAEQHPQPRPPPASQHGRTNGPSPRQPGTARQGPPLTQMQPAHLVVHALCGHALIVGQSGDLPALWGLHPAAAEGHLLEAIRLAHIRTIGQPCRHRCVSVAAMPPAQTLRYTRVTRTQGPCRHAHGRTQGTQAKTPLPTRRVLVFPARFQNCSHKMSAWST